MSNVQTVCGKIRSKELGFTLMHEHCILDTKNIFENLPQLKKNGKKTVENPITLENRGAVIYGEAHFLQNGMLNDVNVPIEELKEYASLGGSSLVDVTPKTLGRSPKAIKLVSESTGVKIIMGIGFYTVFSRNEKQRKMLVKDIAQEILSEFEDGVDDTSIKPGIIGEVGISDINDENDIKYLRASGMAQREIGCAISIHPPIWRTDGHKILDVLEQEGVSMDKIVLGHSDPTCRDFEYHDSLAKRGAFVQYDQFGAEWMTHEYGQRRRFLPCDGERIEGLCEQIKRGNVEHILMSHDVCSRIQFKKWGGWGYSHIQRHIIPRLKDEGVTDEQIHTITVENPIKVLSF
jgi:phosphotriesterase-related protein